MPDQTKAMRVIPEPAPKTRTVLVTDFQGPAVASEGPIDYICGTCALVLLKGVAVGMVQKIVVRCGSCGAFNEIPED